MKTILIGLIGLFFLQTVSKPGILLMSLPAKDLKILRDSTTQADIVFNYPLTSSMSLDGRNVNLFSTFLENKSCKKTGGKPMGFIMWQIRGREFLTGDFYISDTLGYLVFKKDGKEYINKLSEQGRAFLKQQAH